MKSRRGWAILIAVLLIFGWWLFIWGGKILNPGGKEWEFPGLTGGRDPGETGMESRRDRRRERTKTKVVKDLSTRELDHYLELRGVNEASMLFVLLNSGDQKYRDIAIQLPDSPLKFMMLSMDVQDNPKRLEWSEKLYELDPLNRVSALRYVNQLMDSGDKQKATQVLATVKNCDHASNGYDRLIGEFEFARDLFGDERFGPLAAQVARTWPARTSHYTVGNYMDSLEYPGGADKAGTAFIFGKAKDYLLDVGHAESGAEMDALIQTRLLLAGFRSESKDPVLKERYSKEIAGIQDRTDVLFNEGLEKHEKVVKHRSAAEDMNHVIENMSEWRARKAGRP